MDLMLKLLLPQKDYRFNLDKPEIDDIQRQMPANKNFTPDPRHGAFY